MRTQIAPALLFAILMAFGVDVAAAVKLDIPKENFLLSHHGKYGEQWVRVFQKDKRWVCQTESMPYFETADNPLSQLDWKDLKNHESKQTDCRDRIQMTDHLAKPFRSFEGCLSDSSVKMIVDSIDRHCRGI